MQLVRNVGVVCGHQDGNLGVPLALHVKQPNPYPVGINLPRTLKDRKKIFECNLLRGEVIFLLPCDGERKSHPICTLGIILDCRCIFLIWCFQYWWEWLGQPCENTMQRIRETGSFGLSAYNELLQAATQRTHFKPASFLKFPSSEPFETAVRRCVGRDQLLMCTSAVFE